MIPSRVRLNPSLGQSVSSSPLVSRRNRLRDRREPGFSSTLIAGHPLRVCSGRVGRRFRRVGETHRSFRLPRLEVGGFHPPYNRQTGLMEQTLSPCRNESLLGGRSDGEEETQASHTNPEATNQVD